MAPNGQRVQSFACLSKALPLTSQSSFRGQREAPPILHQSAQMSCIARTELLPKEPQKSEGVGLAEKAEQSKQTRRIEI
jgi:hypothetical protein